MLYNTADYNERRIQFISRNHPVKIATHIKETKDRVIITRYITLKNKTIKKIEIFDIK